MKPSRGARGWPHRAMPIGAKWWAIGVTWLTIAVSASVVDNTSIGVGLLALAIEPCPSARA